MKISDVQITLTDGKDQRLLAYCTLIIDNAIVIHDVKVIRGSSGIFIAMPSRRITVRCSSCHSKCASGDKFCCHCGSRLKDDDSQEGQRNQFVDVVHPINSKFREIVHAEIMRAYEQKQAERDAAQASGTESES